MQNLPSRLALLVLVFVPVLATAVTVPANASCLIPKSFTQLSPTNGYHYVVMPAGVTDTAASRIGRFWQPGQYAATGEGTCDERYWLLPCPGCVPGAPGPVFQVDGVLGGMECNSGCPAGEMVVLLEETSADGTNAFLAVSRVTEQGGDPAFDFARIGRDWTLRPIPSPIVVSTTGGQVFYAQLRFDDPAPAFYGLAGVPASGTITAFHLFRGGPGATRDRATWQFVKRIPHFGGVTTDTVTLECPADGLGVPLAAALELDNGQVVTDYVSRAQTAACDPHTPGAGRTPDRGSGALRVGRSGASDVTLSWGASCASGDDDFEVYEGAIGSWTSHTPRACSTGGARHLTLAPQSDAAYFLVVPFDPEESQFEGSYGLLPGGSERPPGATSCRVRRVQACF